MRARSQEWTPPPPRYTPSDGPVAANGFLPHVCVPTTPFAPPFLTHTTSFFPSIIHTMFDVVSASAGEVVSGQSQKLGVTA